MENVLYLLLTVGVGENIIISVTLSKSLPSRSVNNYCKHVP